MDMRPRTTTREGFTRHHFFARRWPRKSGAGFTLIELLVVISIIALLSSVILAAVNSARLKGRAATVAVQMQQIERALKLLALDQNRATWWDASDWGQEIISINNLISSHGLDAYLAPVPPPPCGSVYQYRNTGATFVCGGNVHEGVTLRIDDGGGCPELFNRLDIIFDNGDGPACGRMRSGGGSGSLYYQLGIHSLDLPL